MNKAAKDYNAQGLELLNSGRLEAAVDFFTKAIAEDPDFLAAYKSRGETLIKLNRVEEGKKDIQKAEGAKKKPGNPINNKQRKVVEKYNLHEVEDLWGSVLSEESYDNDDDLFLDDLLYDGDYSDEASGGEQDLDTYDLIYEEDKISHDASYSDGALGDDQALDAGDDEFEGNDNFHDEIPAEDETAPVSSEPEFTPAVLEFIGGMRQEVSHVKLFEPLENSLVIFDEETNDEQVVFFDQLTCLRVSRLPARISEKRQESWTREIIETNDGKIFHELVHSEQDLNNLLLCLSEDDQTPFPFILFPESIIKQRTQNKQLTDILLEKRFISKMMLHKALQEYEQVKGMTLEKIIAQKARVPLAEIEEAIEQAQQNQMQGLQKEEILLFSGLVAEEEILDAVEQLEYIEKLEIDQFLVEKGIVREKEVYISLAEKHGVPFLDLTGRKISKKSFNSLPESMIENHEILPLGLKDDILLVATYVVDTVSLSEAIVKIADCKEVKFVLTPPSQIRKIIKLLLAKRK